MGTLKAFLAVSKYYSEPLVRRMMALFEASETDVLVIANHSFSLSRVAWFYLCVCILLMFLWWSFLPKNPLIISMKNNSNGIIFCFLLITVVIIISSLYFTMTGFAGAQHSGSWFKNNAPILKNKTKNKIII